MTKTDTYIEEIKAQVEDAYGGQVPKRLLLTIRNYANAMEMRDVYREKIVKDGATIIEKGSTGQTTKKQHPLCGLLYQQEMLCLNYANALGLNAKNIAPTDTSKEPMEEYWNSIK